MSYGEVWTNSCFNELWEYISKNLFSQMELLCLLTLISNKLSPENNFCVLRIFFVLLNIILIHLFNLLGITPRNYNNIVRIIVPWLCIHNPLKPLSILQCWIRILLLEIKGKTNISKWSYWIKGKSNIAPVNPKRQMFLSYRNQSINLQGKSIDWFLYEKDIDR